MTARLVCARWCPPRTQVGGYLQIRSLMTHADRFGAEWQAVLRWRLGIPFGRGFDVLDAVARWTRTVITR